MLQVRETYVEGISMDILKDEQGRADLIAEGVSYEQGVNEYGEGMSISVEQFTDLDGSFRRLVVTVLQRDGSIRVKKYNEQGIKVGEILGGRWY